MPRIRKPQRIIAVLDTVAPLTARRIARALGETNLESVRATLCAMQRDGRIRAATPTARERYDSRGRVQRAWELNRHHQPEQQHQGVRL